MIKSTVFRTNFDEKATGIHSYFRTRSSNGISLRFIFSTASNNRICVLAGRRCYKRARGWEDDQWRRSLFFLLRRQNICHREFIWFSSPTFFSSDFHNRKLLHNRENTTQFTFLSFLILLRKLFCTNQPFWLSTQASKGGSTANNNGTITGDAKADGTNHGIRTILTVSKIGFT